MNRNTVIALWMLLAAVTAGAQEFRSTATAGFVFLEIPMTARSAALGEATVALADAGSSGLFMNPAAIGFMTASHSVSFSTARWFAEIDHFGGSYALTTEAGNFGITTAILDYGTMPLTVRTGGERTFASIGTFTAQAAAVGLTYSRALTDRFSFGVGLKYVRETIHEYSASNILFDGGIIYHTGFRSLRLGASMMNFGTNAQYINDPFKMPTLLRLGVAAELLGGFDEDLRVTGLAEALHPSDAPERVNAGVEVGLYRMVTLRAGYKFFSDEESFTAGVGLDAARVMPLALDVAVSRYGRLGDIVRLTITGAL
ncbi:MAG: PorV/PorQ family protein [Bacteroidetes bacterium]|nr:MAG: PorV/PorQ family protein [Bacteroidota bacterium]